MAKVSAAVDMMEKTNKLLMDNPVAAVFKQLLKQTREQIEKLETWASDIEKYTEGEGMDLMRKAVALGEDVQAYGEDWEATKQQWCKQAETLVKLLQRVDLDAKGHMATAESLVNKIVDGTKEYLTRGRDLKKQVEDVKAQSTITEAKIKNMGESMVEGFKQNKKDAKKWHSLWAAAAVMPIGGILVGTVATLIIEFKCIPDIENKIKDVRGRVNDCTRFWGDIRELCDNMSILLEKWIKEVQAIRASALEVQDMTQQQADLVGLNLSDVNKFFQEQLIESFSKLSVTLKKYA